MMIQGIKESLDIDIQNPVDTFTHQTHPDRIQRIVLGTIRTIAIGESKKVFFIDVIQHCHYCLLSNFIFQAS